MCAWGEKRGRGVSGGKEELGKHCSCILPTRQTALEALGSWPGGLQMGGGVNTDNAMEYLDAGASHVIVTSFVFREGRLDEGRLAALVRRKIGGGHN